MISFLIIGLLISLIISLSTCIFLIKKVLNLQNTNLDLNLKFHKATEISSPFMEIGSRAIVQNYPLTCTQHDGKKTDFFVTYEVEILDITPNNVKVDVKSFTSPDPKGNDPANRQGILDILKDKWIERSKIELIIDDASRRNSKIDKILS